MACVKKIQGLNDKGDETDLEFLLIVTRVKPALATTSLQQSRRKAHTLTSILTSPQRHWPLKRAPTAKITPRQRPVDQWSLFRPQGGRCEQVRLYCFWPCGLSCCQNIV